MTDPDRDIQVGVRLAAALEWGTLPRELLIEGPAGTGKTYSILAFLHMLAADYPNMRQLWCRATRVALTESILATFEREILPADGMERIARGASRKHRSGYVYPNGSEIVLSGTDDPVRIGSTAWDMIYVNEAIEQEEEIWDTLGTRLNRPGSDPRFGYLIGDTNPGDPASWLNRRCEDGRTARWQTTHEANPAMHGGMGWTPDGVVYMERLGKLRGTRRKRLLEGLWAAGEGQWFSTFSDQHVSASAEYDPAFQVRLAVDSGVHTGAVWFQVRGEGPNATVTVFGDYYAYDQSAYSVAKDILARSRELCKGRVDRGLTDPAGKSRNAIGVTVLAEYERAGLRLNPWPHSAVPDGLALLDSFVSVDPPGLLVHPRCVHLLTAFANYQRCKRGSQYLDIPIDPQHPHEDLIDPLRGGLVDRFPDGRRPQPVLRRVFAQGGRIR